MSRDAEDKTNDNFSYISIDLSLLSLLTLVTNKVIGIKIRCEIITQIGLNTRIFFSW